MYYFSEHKNNTLSLNKSSKNLPILLRSTSLLLLFFKLLCTQPLGKTTDNSGQNNLKFNAEDTNWVALQIYLLLISNNQKINPCLKLCNKITKPQHVRNLKLFTTIAVR